MKRGCLVALAVVAVIIAAVGGIGFYLSDKIHLRSDHAEIRPVDFDRKHRPEQLRADFTAMVETMRHVHPEFGSVVNSTSFAAQESRILADLSRPMTRVEAWRVMAAINGEIRDGHSALRRPEEEWRAAETSHRYFPAELAFDDDGMVVRQSHALAIPDGARIQSINGRSAAALRDWIAQRVSGESLAFRRSSAASNLNAYFWLAGLRAPYRITWSILGQAPQTAVTDGVSSQAFEGSAGIPKDSPLALELLGNVAVLRIDSFEEADSVFADFVEEAFATIQRHRVTALIIDLRNNGGGASSQGDLLQSYLADKLLPALRDVTVKTTPEVKARYRTLLPHGFRWIPLNTVEPGLRAIQNNADNGFLVMHPEPERPVPRKRQRDNVFQGPLYILIGPNTYSSAAIFAAPLVYWRRATAIGQATGEPLTFFGDNYEFDLARTRIQASVSHKRFRLVGRGDPHAGLQPDLLVDDGQDALTAARQLIARRTRTTN